MFGSAAHSTYTYGDYCRFPEDERWEIIDGQLHAMSPAPSRQHQSTSMALSAQLHAFFSTRGYEVFAAPFDVRLPETQEDDDAIVTVVQPDLVVVCDENKLDDRGCRGAPDWIIEILSPSTAAKDQIVKRELFERHGVKEYWLLHPIDRMITSYRRDADGRFGPASIQEARGDQAVGLFAELTIDWDRVFPR